MGSQVRCDEGLRPHVLETRRVDKIWIIELFFLGRHVLYAWLLVVYVLARLVFSQNICLVGPCILCGYLEGLCGIAVAQQRQGSGWSTIVIPTLIGQEGQDHPQRVA